ncbi:MAG: hypothetical protein AAB518_03185 [Patescibacteria group bacterium]
MTKNNLGTPVTLRDDLDDLLALMTWISSGILAGFAGWKTLAYTESQVLAVIAAVGTAAISVSLWHAFQILLRRLPRQYP